MDRKDSKVIVGIDLGGTTIKIGIVNTAYEITAIHPDRCRKTL